MANNINQIKATIEANLAKIRAAYLAELAANPTAEGAATARANYAAALKAVQLNAQTLIGTQIVPDAETFALNESLMKQGIPYGSVTFTTVVPNTIYERNGFPKDKGLVTTYDGTTETKQFLITSFNSNKSLNEVDSVLFNSKSAKEIADFLSNLTVDDENIFVPKLLMGGGSGGAENGDGLSAMHRLCEGVNDPINLPRGCFDNQILNDTDIPWVYPRDGGPAYLPGWNGTGLGSVTGSSGNTMFDAEKNPYGIVSITVLVTQSLQRIAKIQCAGDKEPRDLQKEDFDRLPCLTNLDLPNWIKNIGTGLTGDGLSGATASYFPDPSSIGWKVRSGDIPYIPRKDTKGQEYPSPMHGKGDQTTNTGQCTITCTDPATGRSCELIFQQQINCSYFRAFKYSNWENGQRDWVPDYDPERWGGGVGGFISFCEFWRQYARDHPEERIRLPLGCENTQTTSEPGIIIIPRSEQYDTRFMQITT